MQQGVDTPQARHKVLFSVMIFLDMTLKHNMWDKLTSWVAQAVMKLLDWIHSRVWKGPGVNSNDGMYDEWWFWDQAEYGGGGRQVQDMAALWLGER